MSKRPTRKKPDEIRGRDQTRPTPEAVGAKIRKAREALGWTQSRLADLVGTTQQTIEKIEAGKVKRTSYLHDILTALNLPPERDIFVKQFPVFHGFIRNVGGEHLRIRRETRGLEIQELAALAGVSPEAIQALETSQDNNVMDPPSPHFGVAQAVDRALRRLERRDPAGEPSSAPGDIVAALPSGELDFPYFRMGETKGIFFDYFGPPPWDIPRVRGYFGLSVSNWIRGSYNFKPIKAGARFYARPFRDPPSEPVHVIAHRANTHPAAIDHVFIGLMIAVNDESATLQLTETGSPLVLPVDDWNFSQVQFAALTDIWGALRARLGEPPAP
ncbi:XRE family transcriptional regulator [Bradyrhizobium frederickii]|uniref:XRE family transcriptional regulator n=1 Tax=Bradyrhizobium frederickii TaxID=2560054 RepID=A0A4Y9NZR9_9BRAD|nr:helix-turn-helix transcriptional regulator [Bradyrhizobium frederickii]TFV71695.1 XRE family transcriptional regulator [Bradyrhizobium frederickii]